MLTIKSLPDNPTEDDLVAAGFRHNEKPIKLLDVERPENIDINIGSFRRFYIIYKDSAAKLNKEAMDLGVIQQPLEMPYVNKKLPDDVQWKDVRQNFINPNVRNLSGLHFIYSQDDTVFAQSLQVGADAFHLNDYFEISDTKALFEHIKTGHIALIRVHHMQIAWITIPEYHAYSNLQKVKQDYARKVEQWRTLKSAVKNAKYQQRKDTQHETLSKLPFDWYTGIKQVLSGISEHSDGTGHRRNTVEHIRLKEDFSKGRLHRVKDDYLCSPKKVPNWSDDGKRTREYIVTCKACLDRAGRLLK